MVLLSIGKSESERKRREASSCMPPSSQFPVPWPLAVAEGEFLKIGFGFEDRSGGEAELSRSARSLSLCKRPWRPVPV